MPLRFCFLLIATCFALCPLVLSVQPLDTSLIPSSSSSSSLSDPPPPPLGTTRHHDFGQYRHVATLSATDFPIYQPGRRVIIIGDIHGMYHSLHDLLTKLSYNPHTDTLIHVGDIVTKAPHKESMQVLSFMASNNITGVRGNHEQQILEWRVWIDWVESTPQGKHWLNEFDRRWDKLHKLGKHTKAWLRKEFSRIPSRWAQKIPQRLGIYGDHHRIARHLSQEQHDYLLSLPLILHIPSAHAFLVHAGLLSSDPRYSPSNHRQPLSRMPVLTEAHGNSSDQHTLRRLQERAILEEVRYNQDPWVNLNMRSITRKGKISRRNHGQPWADTWNDDMEACNGFDSEDLTVQKHKKRPSLFCLPSTVVYGHAAKRGLDVQRWSIGLDTGCVYDRHLTALVLGDPPQFNLLDAQEPNYNPQGASTIPFGDDVKGKIVAVKCHRNHH